MDEIKQYKKGKFLGQGCYGSVYLLKKDGKEYSCKIEKVLPEEAENPEESILEIKFAINVANKYPEYFKYLHSYKVVNTNIKYTGDCKSINPGDFYDRLSKSKYAIIKIYDYLPKSVMIKNWQYSSVLVQKVYAIWLAKQAGYGLTDIYNYNITVIPVPRKNISIMNHLVDNKGIAIKILDYSVSAIITETTWMFIEAIIFSTTFCSNIYKECTHNEIYDPKYLQQLIKLENQGKLEYDNYEEICIAKMNISDFLKQRLYLIFCTNAYMALNKKFHYFGIHLHFSNADIIYIAENCRNFEALISRFAIDKSA